MTRKFTKHSFKKKRKSFLGNLKVKKNVREYFKGELNKIYKMKFAPWEKRPNSKSSLVDAISSLGRQSLRLWLEGGGSRPAGLWTIPGN